MRKLYQVQKQLEAKRKFDLVRTHLKGNRTAYLAGIGGLAIGSLLTRALSHRDTSVTVNVHLDGYPHDPEH